MRRAAAVSEDTQITRSSGNIFADICLRHLEEHLVKADVAVLIGRLINRHGLTQSGAAVKLGLAQADLSRVLRGQLIGFSLERLLSIVRELGQDRS
jgi:predicted XRE-type DNA-binding protein